MLIDILLLAAGLLLVVFGADFLVDGASGVARRFGVSEFVIGLTIVGFGTSCPELVVSLNGAFNGLADISTGNVVGSNIFNTLLILGVTALLGPIAVSSANRKRDIPVTAASTLLLVVCGLAGNGLSRIDGIIFLLLFALYIYLSFKFDDKTQTVSETEGGESPNLPKSAVLVIAGLSALIFGGDLFVDSAVKVAKELGVSDKFIAITLLAGGTSLPELATCIVSSFKHKDQLALGNILGSNVFNILLILGVSSVVTPLSFRNIDFVDLGVLVASILLVWLSTVTGRKKRIDRSEGALMILLFAAYYVYLFFNSNALA